MMMNKVGLYPLQPAVGLPMANGRAKAPAQGVQGRALLPIGVDMASFSGACFSKVRFSQTVRLPFQYRTESLGPVSVNYDGHWSAPRLDEELEEMLQDGLVSARLFPDAGLMVVSDRVHPIKDTVPVATVTCKDLETGELNQTCLRFVGTAEDRSAMFGDLRDITILDETIRDLSQAGAIAMFESRQRIDDGPPITYICPLLNGLMLNGLTESESIGTEVIENGHRDAQGAVPFLRIIYPCYETLAVKGLDNPYDNAALWRTIDDGRLKLVKLNPFDATVVRPEPAGLGDPHLWN
ncbi:MAG: hypothetical protein KC475_06040 [Cyanobacteria bacterium HKST-UBA03]|nr:hypothetical protein [Cyanobacteria bacterium HKST-UBA03]